MAYRKPTGALLKAVRPDAYRQVAELLAEPREHVSYREIARLCKVGGSTIKAIEQVEAAPIAERKAKMLQRVTRVAERAWETVEDKLDGANLAQATICAGVATEKMLLLAGEATAIINVNLNAHDLAADFDRIGQNIAEVLGSAKPTKPIPAIDGLPDRPVLEAQIVS